MKSKNRPYIVAISAVSGGGKTAVTTSLNRLVPNSKALRFDDYDFEGPEDICDWLDRGANYEEWKLQPLIDDLTLLISEVDSKTQYIFLDYPFSYIHKDISEFINLSIFIDTPLDIAMARRMLRDIEKTSINDVENDLKIYMFAGRAAYLEMLNTVMTDSDLVIDGTATVEAIAEQIYGSIR